ncbi:NADH(P)-binding-domain-containing protein [Aspergillus undulatus]|uniref:NADH(P)-binding-domain-containing protein n=1 Tax=Aspergillus undulatus TaxID=1810928 RepID=UPI003CCD3C97
MAVKKSLKVAVLGPTGQRGSCVVDELLSRGYQVVGISRNPPTTWKGSRDALYTGIRIDINNTEELSSAFSDGFDTIVCAFAPPLSDLTSTYEAGVEGHGRIKKALLDSTHEGTFIVIGGAGSLHLENGIQLIDQKDCLYSWWYEWPDTHFHYMRVRTMVHGMFTFPMFIMAFQWARNNVERPGCE